MAEGSTNGRRRFSDKWGKHELDVLAVLSSAFPQWLTSRQIAQRVKAYADSYGELADQAAKAAFAKQFQRDRAKLTAMGIAIESRQPEYSSKSEGQDFASYRLQLGDEPRVMTQFQTEDMPLLAAANYLARSIAANEQENIQRAKDSQHKSRSTPRLAQTPTPGLGLDSIAPGLGTQKIPEVHTNIVDSRRFAATVEFEGENINVAYTDSDDLASYVLDHPGSRILEPVEAREAYKRRLNASKAFELADLSVSDKAIPASDVPVISVSELLQTDDELPKKQPTVQTGSEVDRRLHLMLFLSAHLGEEYSLTELADRFIGPARTPEEERRNVNTLRKDIGTLTTVSDDGEVAGSQFFEIDWPLLEDEGIVSATNSLGLERLAGVSPQYMSMLTASASYLAHSPLMPDIDRKQAMDLYNRLYEYSKPGQTPWLSLTGFELAPACFPIIKHAIEHDQLLDMEYTDGSGRTRRRLVAPAKVFVDEGVYYLAAWTGVGEKDRKVPAEDPIDEEDQAPVRKRRNSKSQNWQTLRLSRIGKVETVEPSHHIDVPEVPLSDLREWNFENGTEAVFLTNQKGMPFIKNLPGATVEDTDHGQKVHLIISSDSWFVAFCIAHARHISAVGPETLRSMITARADRELTHINQQEEADSKRSEGHRRRR